MAKQFVFADAVSEGRLKRIHIVETLAGKVSLAKEILINIGNGGRVRIDAGVAGKYASKPRTRGARERNTHARLHDAVAACYQFDRVIKLRPIQWMNRRAHEFARRVTRKLRVGIECYHVTHATEQRLVSGPADEARVRGATQQPVKLFQLSALALPTDPATFSRIPLPAPLKQMKAQRLSFAMAIIEFADPGLGNFQQQRVVGSLFRGRVGKITEQRKINMLGLIGEKMNFESFHQSFDLQLRGKDRRDHDHRARSFGNTGGRLHSRHQTRRKEMRHIPIQHAQGEIARRHQPE